MLEMIIPLYINMHYFNGKTRLMWLLWKKTMKNTSHSSNRSPITSVSSLWSVQLGNLGIKMNPELPSSKYDLRWHSCQIFYEKTRIYSNSNSTGRCHNFIASTECILNTRN